MTMFTDRPFRNALLISESGLATNWQAWFADSAPNAVLTFPGNRAPEAIVVELTGAQWNPGTRVLAFTAVRDPSRHDPAQKGTQWRRRATPRSAADASLFIDDARHGQPQSHRLERGRPRDHRRAHLPLRPHRLGAGRMNRYRGTLELCDDCLFTAHIGWDESFTGLPVPTPTPLNRIPAAALIGYPVLDEAGHHSEGHYSSSPCAGCGDPDAGIRTITWVTYTHREAV